MWLKKKYDYAFIVHVVLRIMSGESTIGNTAKDLHIHCTTNKQYG